MFRIAVLLSCVVLCCSHAVLPHVPLVVPAVHSVPLVTPYHGYGHGYGQGVWGHGFLAKPLGHHIFKRSPHLVAPLAHSHGLGHVGHVAPIAHVAPVAHVAPLAVSHQSRVDVRTAPAAVAIVKPVVAPVVAAPIVHGLGYYGAGHGLYGGGLGGYGGHAGYALGHHGAGHYGHY